MKSKGICCIGIVLLIQISPVTSAEYNISQIPIQTAETAEPNVMILMDNSGSMRDRPSGASSGKTKMEQAKSAAKAVIESGNGMRIGLTSFNVSEGGKIDRQCGSSKTDLLATLETYQPETWTPLAETHYEVTRYFRGMKGRFSHTGSAYTSPITSQCQKNFTIVITDGEPTEDGNFSSLNDTDAGNKLPNWDTADDDRKWVSGRRGGLKTAPTKEWYYLDDLAKFGWDTDMSSLVGTQNMYTYAIGFDIDLVMLKDTAEKGHGEYFTAGNESELLASLDQVFADISRKVFSSSQLSASSGYVTSGLNIYQASYNTAGWSGELNAYGTSIDSSTGVLEVDSTPQWQASGQIPESNSRVVITNRGGQGVPLRWNQYTAAEKTALFSDQVDLIDYIRGKEISGYRSRRSALGDIVHSNPIFIGAPALFSSNKAYQLFKQKWIGREPMIYVGANDGMLHGFRASDGKELLAYIPSVLTDKLKLLATTDYGHQYFVDGTPTIQDAELKGQWRTVLAGGLNAGGQGVYLLDITEPSGFSETNADKVFQWEFTDQDDPDMGYSFARPAIVRMKDDKWYAVFGNGYNNTEADGIASTSGDAVIYLVSLDDKTRFIKLSTETGLNEAPVNLNRSNGMSTVSLVSDDGISITSIYGGDLYGNVWKFDVDSAKPSDWALDYKLFQACTGLPCSADSVQPITSKVAVSENSSGKNMALFGTGKNFEQSDKTDLSLRSFYGLVDNGSEITNGRGALLQQAINTEGDYSFNGVTRTVRTTTNNRPSKANRGWYMDLASPDGSGGTTLSGERVIYSPVVKSQRVTFSTLTFDTDPCNAGGRGWEMSLDKESGSALSYIRVDNNRDGKFDDNDKVTSDDGSTAVVSGEQTGNGTNDLEIQGTDTNTRVTNDEGGDKPKPNAIQKDPEKTGRISWQYLER